jgi:hypothetical protein
LRGNSCYRGLRVVVDFIFALSVLGVFFYAVQRFRTAPESGIAAVALSLVSIFLIALAIAARQTTLILIDIADSLLRRNSKDDTE